MVAEFHRRRDAICAGLNQIPGFRCAIPGGAFYAFANVTGTGMKSKELADYLLYEARRLVPERRLLRRVRRRLHPLQLRQFPAESDGSRRAHPESLGPLGMPACWRTSSYFPTGTGSSTFTVFGGRQILLLHDWYDALTVSV